MFQSRDQYRRRYDKLVSSPAGLRSQLLACLLIGSRSLSAAHPLAATVCELETTPAKYADRLVIVPAESVAGDHAAAPRRACGTALGCFLELRPACCLPGFPKLLR